MNAFQCNLSHEKPSFSISKFGFQVVILQVQNEQFKWTVVFTSSLHSLTEQSKGILFSLLDLTNLPPLENFLCQKIWNTKMAYGISVVFCISIHSSFLFLIPFYSASFLCFLTSQNECFSVQSFAQKTFPSNSQSNEQFYVDSCLYNFASLLDWTK